MRISPLAHMPSRLRFACFGAAGACLGMGAWVAVISNAGSYLSNDPKACINCHIMFPEYATWRRSSHGRDAVCNDCHVPHDSLLREYWFHAKDGARHSAVFTFRLEPQVLKAIPESKAVIEENCRRCHAAVVSEAVTPMHAPFTRSCTDCHRDVPHGREHSRNAVVPPEGANR